MSQTTEQNERTLTQLPTRCREVSEWLLDHPSSRELSAASDRDGAAAAPDALIEHLTECDHCRDLRFDLERTCALVRDAALDYRHPADFEARLTERLATMSREASANSPATNDEVASPLGGSDGVTPVGVIPTGAPVPDPPAPSSAPGPGLLARALGQQRGLWLLMAASVVALVMFTLRKRPTIEAVRQSAPGRFEHTADAALQGRVLTLTRGFGSAKGLSQCDGVSPGASCQPLAEGDALPAGAVLVSDGLTRARIELHDGTEVALDRGAKLALVSGRSRRSHLLEGDAIFDVRQSLPTPFTLDLPQGELRVLGTKFAVHVREGDTRVDVSRGEVELEDRRGRDVRVRAGQSGRLFADAAPRVEAVADLGRAFAWNERAFAGKDPDKDPSADLPRGIGELRAKKPGATSELEGAVTLARHAVRVTLHEVIARTEVEEVFTNHTDDVLEGIFRFPLPPDAQIERLALEVDGHWEEGAFVDRERAAAIWRGAIVNGGGKRQSPREEIVWVPGPWRDPALLEWQAGGKFELRIYPIPKRGERRVLLAYTQRLSPQGEHVRYTYPLPHDPNGSTRVRDFSFEVTPTTSLAAVRSDGHSLAPVAGLSRSKHVSDQSAEDGGQRPRYGFEERDFTPDGDITLEATLTEAQREARGWAHRGRDGSNHVALALRPNLPAASTDVPRAVTFVVDRSRSMLGEQFRRASAVIERSIRELDQRALVMVLDCDVRCSQFAPEFRAAGPELAAEVGRYLASLEPEGASDLGAMLASGIRTSRRAEDRDVHVVYVGDGSPSVGPVDPALLGAELETLRSSRVRVSAVTVGSAADLGILRTLTRVGGGVLIEYAPGRSAFETAFDVLHATYGGALSEVEVTLPPGLYEMTPRAAPTLLAGDELLIAAKMDRPEVEGDVTIRGKLGDQPFTRSYPIRIVASSSAGNAFVPRWFAEERIRELEQRSDAAARQETVDLSRRFGVASRHTSLLVLESPMMFKAFGIDTTRPESTWSGEFEAEGTAVGEFAEEPVAMGPGSGAGAGRSWPGGSDEAPSLGSRDEGSAKAKRSIDDGRFAPPPSKPAPMPDDIASERRRRPIPPRVADDPLSSDFEPVTPWPRRMVPMRKIWERKGNIGKDLLLVTHDELAQRERAFHARPLDRDALKKLYAAYLLSDDLSRAADLAAEWIGKDPLDPDALTARADLAALRGDRELSLRMLGSVVDARPHDHAALFRLARAYTWAGNPEQACRYSIAEAQRRNADAPALERATSCLRTQGNAELAERLAAAAPEAVRRQAQRSTVTSFAQQLDGDFRLNATWDDSADLDLVIVHPDGYRVSWLGAPTQAVISALDVLDRGREGLALRGSKAGSYAIEIVRGDGSESTVHGEVQIRVGDTQRRIPFTLSGSRARIAGIKVSMASRLVPL